MYYQENSYSYVSLIGVLKTVKEIVDTHLLVSACWMPRAQQMVTVVLTEYGTTYSWILKAKFDSE